MGKSCGKTRVCAAPQRDAENRHSPNRSRTEVSQSVHSIMPQWAAGSSKAAGAEMETVLSRRSPVKRLCAHNSPQRTASGRSRPAFRLTVTLPPAAHCSGAFSAREGRHAETAAQQTDTAGSRSDVTKIARVPVLFSKKYSSTAASSHTPYSSRFFHMVTVCGQEHPRGVKGPEGHPGRFLLQGGLPG